MNTASGWPAGQLAEGGALVREAAQRALRFVTGAVAS